MARPVLIFLPIEEGMTDAEGVAVDPVCGRTVGDGTIAGRLLHDGRQHYFCSLACAKRFAADPKEFATR